MDNFEIKKETNPTNKEIINQMLIDYNSNFSEHLTKEIKSEKLEFYIYDKDKNVIGGLCGAFHHNNSWLHVEYLAVKEGFQGYGLASKLMEMAEEEALKKNVKIIRVETWEFQARPFYEKLGFELVATIKDCPPEVVEYVLTKKI